MLGHTCERGGKKKKTNTKKKQKTKNKMLESQHDAESLCLSACLKASSPPQLGVLQRQIPRVQMISRCLIGFFLMTLQATALSFLPQVSASVEHSQLVCGGWVCPRHRQRSGNLSPGVSSDFHKNRSQPKIKLYHLPPSGSKSKAPNTHYFEIPGFLP